MYIHPCIQLTFPGKSRSIFMVPFLIMYEICVSVQQYQYFKQVSLEDNAME